MARKRKNKKILQLITSTIVLIGIIIFGYINQDVVIQNNIQNEIQEEKVNFDLSTIPEYTDKPYIEINNNIPDFTEEDYSIEPFEKYNPLDYLGRCGVAFANICKEIMPQEGEERESISSVIPSGWKQKEYDGKYLYNRCHLIGYQLSAENANEQNLITGTQYLNIEGMLPFENQIAEYIDNNPNNHVLYRVTPIFKEENLLASGVQLEALSVEDNGKGIKFNVYCYNVQPGVEIDYKTGESHEK